MKWLLFLPLAIATASSGFSAQVVRGPYLQSASHDRMTLCWRTDVATTTEVAYATDLAGDFTSVPVAGTRTDHAVTITGLAAGSRYFYRVLGTPETGAPVSVSGPNHWFRTAPAPGTAGRSRIWVIGDSGFQYPGPINCFNAYMAKTAAAGRSTDVMLMLGDNAYADSTDNQMQGAIFNRYPTLFRNCPVWSAFGNHDGGVPAQPFPRPMPYEIAFRFPMAGESGGVPSGSELYFSFNHGNIHFIALDTNSAENAYDVPGGAYGMVDWLLDDLRACPADWIIVFMHQGPYSKGGSHNSDSEAELVQTRAHVVPLLESYGADLVLYGHSHVYERSRLIDGHYGNSTTWNAATMLKQGGNGSDLGGVDGSGNFQATPAAATGSYQKPAATGRAGTIYATVGASSVPSRWLDGSTALVSPSPHPVHITNLNLLGNLVLEVDGQRLNGQYLDEFGAIRDDFTILKGADYSLQGAAPAFGAEGSPGISFVVSRTGATGFAEQVSVAAEQVTGGNVTPTQATADFAAGQTHAVVTFAPESGTSGASFQARLLTVTRAVQPGAAERQAYRISGGPQPAKFAATPADTWYASRFGAPPANPGAWDADDEGDGLSLLLEYALGGEPSKNDRNLLPRGQVEGGSFVFRYLRPPGRSDLSYRVKSSTDLLTWPLPDLPEVSDGPASAAGEPRKVTMPLGSSRFLSLEASLQP